MLSMTGIRERLGNNFTAFLTERTMSKRGLNVVYEFVSIVFVLVNAGPAAAYVVPQIGGGQVGSVSMIMPEITFDGTNVVVLDTFGNPWTTLTGADRPVLRSLTGTDQLDPANVPVYNALNGTAWNWQYGWANDLLNKSLIPAGDKIWIQLITQSDGLNTYARSSYAPIWGTGGTSNIWKWNEMMGMSHNAYTVTPGYGEWSATYNVYLGDMTSGAAISGYGSDTVTLTWTSIPEPATLALMGTGLFYLLGSRRKH
jgi:hypothetical protein